MFSYNFLASSFNKEKPVTLEVKSSQVVKSSQLYRTLKAILTNGFILI